MEFLKTLEDFFNHGDPVIKEWFMVRNNVLPFASCFFYVILTLIGPYFMRNRKPYDLRNVMIIFNFGLVCTYVYVLTTAVIYLPQISWDLFCFGGTVVKGEPSYILMTAAWVCYLLKYIEFLDTLFFILRKKENLITFLHVFHHTSVPIVAWMLLRTEKNGLQAIPALINTVIHVVMYSYYGLAAVGPSVRKYLWWKKYLTQIQIIQFIYLMLHFILVPYLTGCPFLKITCVLNYTLSPLFFYLFYRFYKMSFQSSRKKVE